MRNQRWKGIFQSLGPGLLMAGAAIGGSHLVQSTRAGADYGLSLLWVILLANLFKYPFFEYGPRYSAATGNNLLQGYQKLGNWAIAIFLIFTFFTMFAILAALTTVTAGLAGQMLGLPFSPLLTSALLLSLCAFILILGKYPLLDGVMKIIIVVLAFSTVFAVISLFFRGETIAPEAISPGYWTLGGISFIVALMGWMPSVIDISVWTSLWSLERRKQTGHSPTVREARIDFNIGYFGAAILAILFLLLGALVMFGSGESFSNSTVTFAAQLVSLYTQSLGNWAAPVIVIAAFTTMFSTTLVVTDAYPRVIKSAAELLIPKTSQKIGGHKIYLLGMLALIAVALLIIAYFQSQIKSLIDMATTLSFLTTPALAYINYKVVMDDHFPQSAKPGLFMQYLSWAGIIFWSGFAAVFIYMKLFL